MPRYRVGIIYSTTQWVDVEADSEEEAGVKGQKEGGGGLCHHCANHYDLEDPTGEFVVEEV